MSPTVLRLPVWFGAVVVSGLLEGCSSTRPIVVGANDAAKDHTIAVGGSARVEIVPNEACIELTLAERDAAVPAAHARLVDDETALLSDLKRDTSLVIEESATTYEPEYETDHDGHSHLAHHVASVRLNVRTRDFARIPDVIGHAAARGLDRVGVVYYSTDIVASRAAVRKRALEAARDKALDMAKTLDVELDGVVSIAEGETDAATSVSTATYLERGRVDSAPDVPAPPGSIPLSMSVNVVYRLKS